MFTFLPLVKRWQESSKCLPWALISDCPQIILYHWEILEMRSWKLNPLHFNHLFLVTHQIYVLNCVLEKACLAQARGWKEKGWSWSWLGEEKWSGSWRLGKVGLGKNKVEPWADISESCLNKGSDHRLPKTPLKLKIGSAAYCRRRWWHTTPVLLPGKSHGWRSLVGWSPWGREESDMTEWLHLHFSLSCIGEGNGNPLQCSCLKNPRDGGAW